MHHCAASPSRPPCNRRSCSTNSHYSRWTTIGYSFLDESGTQAQSVQLAERTYCRQYFVEARGAERSSIGSSKLITCVFLRARKQFLPYVPPHHISNTWEHPLHHYCHRYTVCHLSSCRLLRRLLPPCNPSGHGRSSRN